MIIESIKSRRSVRGYKSDSVSDEIINEIIMAAEFAPTAHNKRAIEFIVVRDKEIKEDIFDVTETEYIKQAPVLIVPVATFEATLPLQDLSIASAHIFLQAAALGLGTVWKNLSTENADKVKEILSIPENCQIINIIPLGFPIEDPLPHLDEEFLQEKIHKEKW